MGVFSPVINVYRMCLGAMKEAFIRLLMGVLIFLGYVLLSLFIYAIMRRIMVPQKLHVIPVHLFFSPCSQQSGLDCPFPQTEFLLNGGRKLLSSGQYYTIALEMELPETSVNEEIGVFMVNITFYTTANKFLSTSARPVMVHYRSSLLYTLSTLFFAPLYLTGIWEQKQTINLLLYEDYYEPYGDGSLSVIVSILNHRIHVYSATLTIDANFSGFTYYLYQWPISMSIIVVISIFITLCTCTVMMWVRDVLRDYDLQRRRGLQRRRTVQRQAAGPPAPPVTAPPPAADGRTTPSEASTETQPGVEDLTAASQASDDDLRTPMPSTPGDTESEVSVGFNEVLTSLQTLSRDIDNDRRVGSVATETGTVDGSEGLRQRTGQ